jgi:NADH dehydrogenase FAD-containing subunit
MAKENIVIVGSGGGGTEVARSLSAKLDYSRFNLILVSPRDYYLHYPAGLRMVATDDGHLEQRAVIPINGIFSGGKGTIKVGTVTSIKKSSGGGGSVTLESGESIPFRYLVLAPGSKWEGPLQLPFDKGDLVSTVAQWREKFKNAGSYVIVGAGSVGLGECDILLRLTARP